MGVIIALTIILSWGVHLFYLLTSVQVNFYDPLFYFHILLQAYLFTGLFITAHDAMHGNITKDKAFNKAIGAVSCFLFAGFSYKRLIKNHYRHHNEPTSEDDPDFSTDSQNFFKWWFRFIAGYTTVSQIIIMAIIYNLLKFLSNEPAVIFFWLIPVILSTLQLFYFGTYLPHRYPERNLNSPHFARSQKKNHLIAMLSCYFFGYHLEHHFSPKTPWWKLYKLYGNFRTDKPS